MNTIDEYDVFVAGGGPAGICAAVAAARSGCKTLLIEMTGALGGMAGTGLVPVICGYTDGKKFIQRGIAKELLDGIREYMGEDTGDKDSIENMSLRLDSKGVHFFIEPEAMKYSADRIAVKSAVHIMFFTTLCRVEMDTNDIVKTATVANKNGIFNVNAKFFIDCTGDADLCTFAGAKTIKGDKNGDMQPASLCMVMNNLPAEWFDNEIWKKIINDNEFPLIKDDFFCPFPIRSLFRTNGGHLWNVDGSNIKSVSQAMINGRMLAKQLLDALHKYVPDTQNTNLIQTADLLGVRETRRIIGEYTLTGDDYRTRRRFEDEIAVNSYYIDTHPSLEKRAREREGKWKWNDDHELYDKGEYHGIPYRCLLPQGLKNVINAGRSISSDRIANSSIRVMANCMSMGQAAGTAAALLLKNNYRDFREINFKDLRTKLKSDGAFLPEIKS